MKTGTARRGSDVLSGHVGRVSSTCRMTFPLVERQAERCAGGDLDDLAHGKSPLHPAGKARSAFQGSLLSDTGRREALEGVSHTLASCRDAINQPQGGRPSPGIPCGPRTFLLFPAKQLLRMWLVETGRLRVKCYGPCGGRCGDCHGRP
jgi:hypothetical protein